MAASDVAPWVAAGGGAVVAGFAGYWQSRQAKTAAAPNAQGALNDGFSALLEQFRAEVARLGVEVARLRAELHVAQEEVEACEEARRKTEARVAALEAQLGRAGVMDRRKSNEGPPPGSRDRRNPRDS